MLILLLAEGAGHFKLCKEFMKVPKAHLQKLRLFVLSELVDFT